MSVPFEPGVPLRLPLRHRNDGNAAATLAVVGVRERWGARGIGRLPMHPDTGANQEMQDIITYDEPSAVDAEGGVVVVSGPGAVDVRMTPDAAEETSQRLLTGALKARGQIYFSGDGRD